MLTDECKGISVTSQMMMVYTLRCCVDGCEAETTIHVNAAQPFATMREMARAKGWCAWIPPEWIDCGEHLCICPECIPKSQ